MRYERIEITPANAEWAVRENFYRIYEAIATKVNMFDPKVRGPVNMGNHKITQVPTPVDDHDLVNLATVQSMLGI